MIRVRDAAEFKRLLTALANDIVDAHIHYKTYKDLLTAAERYPLVFHQSNTFWSTTLKAHSLATITLLSRAFDQEKTSLHLSSWLLTIKENLELFGDSSFRERLRDNPFVDSLANGTRRPDLTDLDRDIANCSKTNPLVKTLLIHRSSAHAHRSARNTVAAVNIGDQHPLLWSDIEILLDRALTVLNRYSVLFEASSYSTNSIGRHDYEYIFQCATKAVEASRRGD